KAFLSRPTLKFAHKDDLNDPFELSRRWSKFGYPFKEGAIARHVRPRLERRLLDLRYVRKRILEDPRMKSLGYSRQQRRQMVATRIKRGQIDSEFQDQIKNIKNIEELLPVVFQGHESELIEKISKTTGILSLTEDAENERM